MAHVSLQAPPYLMKNPDEPEDADNSPNALYRGYCKDLTEKIAERVGFDYNIRPVLDGNYGAEDENGTWNGMVGELIRKVPFFVSFICVFFPV